MGKLFRQDRKQMENVGYAYLLCGSIYTAKRKALCFRCGKNLRGVEAIVGLTGLKFSWKRLLCKTCVRSEDIPKWERFNKSTEHVISNGVLTVDV